MTDILTRANEVLTTTHMIFSGPEYRAVVRGLVEEIKRKDEALLTVAQGLRSGMVKAKPLMRVDPNATSLPIESLDDIVAAALTPEAHKCG